MSLKRKRERYIQGHLSLSDDAFASALGVTGDVKRLALAVRQPLPAFAKCLRSTSIPATRPSKSLTSDWDQIKFVLALENILGLHFIDDDMPSPRWKLFWWRGPGCATIGEWTLRVAQWLQANPTQRT